MFVFVEFGVATVFRTIDHLLSLATRANLTPRRRALRNTCCAMPVAEITMGPELAKDRRERWWRLTVPSVRWVSGDFDDDPARQVVAGASVSLNLDRQAGLVRAWHAVREERPMWNGAAFSVDKWLHLTPAELGEPEQENLALPGRWEQRNPPDDGQAREPVFLFAHGVPARP
jgi:hypothetical protein